MSIAKTRPGTGFQLGFRWRRLSSGSSSIVGFVVLLWRARRDGLCWMEGRVVEPSTRLNRQRGMGEMRCWEMA